MWNADEGSSNIPANLKTCCQVCPVVSLHQTQPIAYNNPPGATRLSNQQSNSSKLEFKNWGKLEEILNLEYMNTELKS